MQENFLATKPQRKPLWFFYLKNCGISKPSNCDKILQKGKKYE
jgi:hypothetical protein